MARGIAILGSTGSIGTQALEVISEQSDRFQVEVLTAGKNWKLLLEQAKQYKPNAVVIGSEEGYVAIKDQLWDLGIKCYSGKQALCDVVAMEGVDVVLTALVGFAGLEPTISAIKAKKVIALANKETLVVAGEIIMPLADEYQVPIIPVDSEHSAIFQCMMGEWQNPIERVILTASGGPFRGKDRAFLEDVTPKKALKHPNWDMGAKITIDSSTLMNKGLEIIEAKWLFNVAPKQIEAVVHPQSIIHSMVEFADGSVKSQMGLPDMKLPILFAFTYPARVKTDYPRMDLTQIGQLTFEKPDEKTFPCIRLAYVAMERGKFSPCIMNAANEIVVEAFLKEQIPFLAIPALIEKAMDEVEFEGDLNIENLIIVDELTRSFTQKSINSYGNSN